MQNSYTITRLILNNYRSYEKLRIDTSSVKNVIITGQNGAGKTNILEAISMLSQAGPFRKAKLQQLGRIESNNPVFTISSQVIKDDRNFNIGLSYNYSSTPTAISEDEEVVEKRQIVVEGKNVSIGELQDYIKIIWITPFMDRLFSEATGERRKFLDNLIGNFYPFYGSALNQYSNLLKQRAKVLKGKSFDVKWLDAIEEQIVEKGVSIAALRIEFEDRLNNILQSSSNAFPKIQIRIEGVIEDRLKTQKSVEVEEFFKQSLLDNRELFKFSFSPPVDGVHRSDFTAYNLDKNISADQTSTGEQKCTVISIILAYANMLYKYFNKYPLILIDEAPAHLDSVKTEELFKEIEKIPTQVWLTGILKSDFDFFKDKNSLFLEIENSSIK